MGKALKMDNEKLRCLEQLHFFLGVSMVLALRTEPLIIACESFLLTEPADAVID